MTKQVHRVGKSASVRANIGTAGRENVGVSGAYSSDKITLSGDLGVRRDQQHSVSTDDRAFPDPVTGQTDTSHSVGTFIGPLNQWNARISADYDVDRATRLSAELRHNTFNFDTDTAQTFQGFRPDRRARPGDQPDRPLYPGSRQHRRPGQLSSQVYRRRPHLRCQCESRTH